MIKTFPVDFTTELKSTRELESPTRDQTQWTTCEFTPRRWKNIFNRAARVIQIAIIIKWYEGGCVAKSEIRKYNKNWMNTMERGRILIGERDWMNWKSARSSKKREDYIAVMLYCHCSVDNVIL